MPGPLSRRRSWHAERDQTVTGRAGQTHKWCRRRRPRTPSRWLPRGTSPPPTQGGNSTTGPRWRFQGADGAFDGTDVHDPVDHCGRGDGVVGVGEAPQLCPGGGIQCVHVVAAHVHDPGSPQPPDPRPSLRDEGVATAGHPLGEAGKAPPGTPGDGKVSLRSALRAKPLPPPENPGQPRRCPTEEMTSHLSHLLAPAVRRGSLRLAGRRFYGRRAGEWVPTVVKPAVVSCWLGGPAREHRWNRGCGPGRVSWS